MRILKIAEKKCIKCGSCSEVCPVKIISFEKGKFPENVSWAKKVCINCGHCVSVCPSGALSLDTMPVEECPPVKDEFQVDQTQVKQLLRSRRSIRVYKKNVVSKDKIEDLIDIARYAPSGHNFQPVKWKIIYDRDKVAVLKDLVLDWMRISLEKDPVLAKKYYMHNILRGCEAGYDLILRGAPHVIITYASEKDGTADHSCRLALSYFEIAAFSTGLGTCWAGYLDMAFAFYPVLRDFLSLPEGEIPYASMLLGYPKFNYKRIPLRKAPVIDWEG